MFPFDTPLVPSALMQRTFAAFFAAVGAQAIAISAPWFPEGDSGQPLWMRNRTGQNGVFCFPMLH